MEQVYQNHAAHWSDLSAYADQVSVTFVPTAAGASGKSQWVEFLKQNEASLRKLSAVSQQPMDGEYVQSKERFFSKDAVTEEWIVSLKHDQDMVWLLPGVKPTQRMILMPMISVTRFNQDNLIVSKRIYWDQATVLRQIFLLPSDVSKLPVNVAFPVHASVLPVLTGLEMTERLERPMEVATGNVLLKKCSDNSLYVAAGAAHPVESSHAVPSAKQAVDMVGGLLSGEFGPEAVRPSTRLNSQHVGGKSSVFDNGDAPSLRSNKSLDPRRNESNISLTDSTASVAETASISGKRFSAQSNQSHFSLSHDPTPKLEQLHLSKRPGAAYHNAASNAVLETEEKQTGRRHGQQHNRSHLDSMWTSATTASSEEETMAEKLQETKKQEPAAKVGVSWESSSNGLGSMQSRPSSRVLQAPGGGSTFSFY